MPHTFNPQDKEQNAPSFHELWQPVKNIFIGMPPLEARGNRPLQMDFEHQLKALVDNVQDIVHKKMVTTSFSKRSLKIE